MVGNAGALSFPPRPHGPRLPPLRLLHPRRRCPTRPQLRPRALRPLREAGRRPRRCWNPPLTGRRLRFRLAAAKDLIAPPLGRGRARCIRRCIGGGGPGRPFGARAFGAGRAASDRRVADRRGRARDPDRDRARPGSRKSATAPNEAPGRARGRTRDRPPAHSEGRGSPRPGIARTALPRGPRAARRDLDSRDGRRGRAGRRGALCGDRHPATTGTWRTGYRSVGVDAVRRRPPSSRRRSS